jgi:hypothetical protein
MKNVTSHRSMLLMTIASVLIPYELATLAYPSAYLSVCRNGLCGTILKE